MKSNFLDFKSLNFEIDMWKIDNDLILGHDRAEDPTSIDWISEYQDKLWIHCKNYEAILFLIHNLSI